MPIVFNYTLTPLLDHVIGQDLNNPPEAVVVPLHFLALFACAWYVGTQEPT